MHSKIDNVLRTSGNCCLTTAALLLALGVVGRPLARPWIAYGLVGIGVLAYAWLVTRGLNVWSAVRTFVVYGVFGAVCGFLAYTIGRAIAFESWSLVTLLLVVSMLVAGLSFWWNARQCSSEGMTD